MKHTVLAILKSTTCVALLFVLSVLTWDRMLAPVLRPVSTIASAWPCETIVKEGPGENRHVVITNIRNDVLPVAGFVSLPEQGVSYLPLVADTVPGNPLSTDYRVFVKCPQAIDSETAEKILSEAELTGYLRRPRYDILQKLNEDQILGEWADQQSAECWVLDSEIPQPAAWTNPQFLGMAAFLIAVGFYGVLVFLTSVITTKFQAALSLMGFGLVCGQGVMLWMIDSTGSAYWNTISPALMVTALVIGGLGTFFTLLRLATLAANDAKSTEDAAVVPTVTGTEPFQVTKLGFVVRDNQGERDYLDVDVESFEILKQDHAQGHTRTFRLKLRSGKETEAFVISDEIKQDQEDPFNPFFARLLSTMVRVYRTKLQAGESLKGKGWEFSLGGFTIGEGANTKNYSHHTITAAEWIDDHFCVWTAEQEEAILRLSSSSENAQVFSFLIEEFIPKKKMPTSNYKHQLGRLLEKAPFTMEVADLSVMMFAVAIVAGIVGVSGVLPGMIPYAIAGGAVLLGVMMKSRSGNATISVFEHGIVLNSGRPQKIPFEEIASYVVRNHGEKTEFALESSQLDAKLEFVLKAKPSSARSAAQLLEERLIAVVSDRLLKLLVQSGQAPWSGPVEFTLDGLKVTEKAKSKVVPFQQIERVDLNDKSLAIICQGGETVTLKRTETNVLPGYKTLQKVLSAVQPKEPAEATTSL